MDSMTQHTQSQQSLAVPIASWMMDIFALAIMIIWHFAKIAWIWIHNVINRVYLIRYLDTFLDTLGVHPDLGDAVHHSGCKDICIIFIWILADLCHFIWKITHSDRADDCIDELAIKIKMGMIKFWIWWSNGDNDHDHTGDLCNASPAFSILTDSVIWFTFGLHCRLHDDKRDGEILANAALKLSWQIITCNM